MNIAVLTGRLTKTPELKTTPKDKYVTTFDLAVNGYNSTDYVRCVAWNKTAELLCNYMSKGLKIGVRGRISTRDYEKDGRKVYVTEVVADEIEFLEKKQEKPELTEAQKRGTQNYSTAGMDDVSLEDLPF